MTMLEHASALASRGFFVFPLRGKEPATAHGCKEATRDPAQIQAWWSAMPGANIGIATGALSNILVLDVDGAEGEASLAALNLPEPTLTVTTPGKIDKKTGTWSGKGRHLYYIHVPGVTIGQSKAGSKIDHRGEGGYVVAPPSVHPDGTGVYEWTDFRTPGRLPDHVAARLLPATARAVDVDSASVSRSLDQWVQAVIDAAPGTKHETLNDAAYAHACAAHEAGEARDVAEVRILNLLIGALTQNLKSQVDDWANAENTVRSGLTKAYARPAAKILAVYERELNEDGLARRFAKAYADRACFVPDQGWRLYDGKRWAEQPGKGLPTEIVSEMLIDLVNQAVKQGDEDFAKAIKAKKTAGSMASVLRLASRHLARPFTEFDADPMLLNVQNGTIDLRTGTLRPHSPADLITRVCSVGLGSSAEAPRWTQALLQMQGGDMSAVTYLQALLGSFIQGSSVDGFWIMHGNGFDGKSTVLQILHMVLGDYARAVNPQVILVAKNGTKPHTSMVGSLAGVRLGTIDELPAECQLDTGAIKAYFGRLPVRVQTGMGKEFVDVTPTAKSLIATNHIPRIQEQDRGTKRRAQVIPFDGDLTAQGVKKDDAFAGRLVAQEGPQILAWLVAGCMAWIRAGHILPTCERVNTATEEMFEEGDTLGMFLEEECAHGAGMECSADDLYKAYKAFAERVDDRAVTKRMFGNKMRERGIKPRRITTRRMYMGVQPKSLLGANNLPN